LCAQHSTAQHSTAQHSTAQHSTAQHSTAQHSTAQHSTRSTRSTHSRGRWARYMQHGTGTPRRRARAPCASRLRRARRSARAQAGERCSGARRAHAGSARAARARGRTQDAGVQHAAGGVERVHCGVDAQLGDAARQHRCRIQVRKRGGGRGVRQVVRGHIHGLGARHGGAGRARARA
jgi:hypothetical protein